MKNKVNGAPAVPNAGVTPNASASPNATAVPCSGVRRTIDEHFTLRRRPGERYGLKNGRGEYLTVQRCARCFSLRYTARAERPEGSVSEAWGTLDASHAARLSNPSGFDEVLAALHRHDASWRTVRLLDHRWN